MKNYMSDCIHLKACRRARLFAKNNTSKWLCLGCNERCSAYVSGDGNRYITVEHAVREARYAFDSIRSGYGNDCLIEDDLHGMTLQEIIDEQQAEGEERE